MKKCLFSLAVVLLLLTGCTVANDTVKGNYKEGTYFGTYEYEYNGQKDVATAVVYVDANGVIKSCFIDTTYMKNDVYTTKKTLGDAYGMKGTSANIGVIPGGGEWYEQINNIEAKIIEEQGLDWVKYDEAGTKLDGFSGATINVSDLMKAVEAALAQAK